MWTRRDDTDLKTPFLRVFTTSSEQSRRFNTEVANLLLSAIDCRVEVGFFNLVSFRFDPREVMHENLCRFGLLWGTDFFFSAAVKDFFLSFWISKYSYMGRKSQCSNSLI